MQIPLLCFLASAYSFAFLYLLHKICASSMQSSVHSRQRMFTQGKSQQDDSVTCSINQAKDIYIWKTIGGRNATLAGSSYSCYSLYCCVIFIALKFCLCWFLILCWYRLTAWNVLETACRNSTMQTVFIR